MVTPITDIVREFSAKPPVNLEGLANRLGIEVVYKKNMGPDVSGKITRKNESKYIITVNSSESLNRQRFTLAHEIAHYVFHRAWIGDGITDDALFRSNLSSRIETEANRYAAQILMPADLVRKKWCDGMRDIKDFSDFFGVSQQSAEIRLMWLGLIPEE